MAQPKYTWWPWRVLAASVGLATVLFPMLLAGTGALDRESPDDPMRLLAVGLTIFAGGNALILGSAMGDFGRMVLALVVSVAVASVFSQILREAIWLAPFAIVPFTAASLSMERTRQGFAAAAALGLGATLIGAMIFGLTFLASFITADILLRRAEESTAVALPFAMACGNLFLVGFLFSAAHRVRTERTRGGLEDEDLDRTKEVDSES